MKFMVACTFSVDRSGFIQVDGFHSESDIEERFVALSTVHVSSLMVHFKDVQRVSFVVLCQRSFSLMHFNEEFVV